MSKFEAKLYKIKVGPHPNADALEVGWMNFPNQLVSVLPKGLIADGSWIVFIPEHAIVPEYILERIHATGKLAGPKKDRVKVVSLRGITSYGLAYPPTEDEWQQMVDKGRDPYKDDWSDVLGLKQWEPEIPPQMHGEVMPYPDILRYTEIEDIAKFPDVIAPGEDVVITEKIHGTCTIFHFAEGMLYVTSKGLAKRGLVLVDDDKNLYWKMAKQLNIYNRFLAYGKNNITVFGETYGDVQDLKYGLGKGEADFRCFDIALEGEFLRWHDFVATAAALYLETVPVVYDGPFYEGYLLNMPNGDEIVSGRREHMREGVVITVKSERHDPELGRVILKCVSDKYLNRRGLKTEFQ